MFHCLLGLDGWASYITYYRERMKETVMHTIHDRRMCHNMRLWFKHLRKMLDIVAVGPKQLQSQKLEIVLILKQVFYAAVIVFLLLFINILLIKVSF